MAVTKDTRNSTPSETPIPAATGTMLPVSVTWLEVGIEALEELAVDDCVDEAVLAISADPLVMTAPVERS